MLKLDSQNRIVIPKNIITLSKTDFSKEVRMYLRGHDFFLDNPSSNYRYTCCLGTINLDNKGRFCITTPIRKYLKINQESNISCFVLDGKVTFRKIYFIPEIR